MADSIKHVQRILKQSGLFPAGSRLLLGVSGGIDSVALFHIFRHLAPVHDFTLAAAHFNHHLRARESKQDALFVKQLCKTYAIPLYSGEEKIQDIYNRTPGKSLEQVARERRFEFFWNEMLRFNADYLVLGHTADDQAETFFMRLLQGSGCRGLSSIAFLQEFPRGKVIHPLLTLKKKRLRSFLEDNHYSWREDASNREKDFLRNRLRQELVPLLKTFNPRIEEFALRYTDYFRELQEYLEKSYFNWEKEAVECLSVNSFSWKEDIIRSWLPFQQKEFIHSFFTHRFQKTLKSAQVEQVHRFITSSQSGKSLSILNNICLEKEFKTILVYYGKKQDSSSVSPVRITGPGTYQWKEWIIRVCTGEDSSQDNNAVAVPAGEKYEIRGFIPGDRITLAGRNITKKLKKVFQEYRIPASYRKSIPLLYSSGRNRILAVFLSEESLLEGITKECAGNNIWLIQAEKLNNLN